MALIASLRALCAVADRRIALQTASLTSEGPEGSVLDIPLPYDPGSVFFLEMMVSIASQTARCIEDVWFVSSCRQCLILTIVKASGF